MATTGPLIPLCPGRLLLILVEVNPEGLGISTVPRPKGLNRMAIAKNCAVHGQKGTVWHSARGGLMLLAIPWESSCFPINVSGASKVDFKKYRALNACSVVGTTSRTNPSCKGFRGTLVEETQCIPAMLFFDFLRWFMTCQVAPIFAKLPSLA